MNSGGQETAERELRERADRLSETMLHMRRIPFLGRLIGRLRIERTKVLDENAVAFQQKTGHGQNSHSCETARCGVFSASS